MTTTTRHTPGPWRLGHASPISGDPCIVRADGRTVCRMDRHNTTERDAYLIAQAPAMYDLLRRMFNDGCFLGTTTDWGPETAAILRVIEEG